MVMAGNESAPGALVDDTLATRLQWLRQRREVLQEKLAQKNNELKNLCVEEAEITGVLPPEIPLEPGESPPTFRRKDATLLYPQKLINKLKTTDAESELELEKQVQLGIVETALSVVNNPTESKATRRKHRLAYQQSQRRLQELETELNFIRQSRGKTHRQPQSRVNTENYHIQLHPHTNVKHRTKKPRPPLGSAVSNEATAANFIGRGVIQETGVDLSPLRTENKCNIYSGHGYEEQPTILSNHHYHGGTYPGINSIDQSNVKVVEHDHNDNHNVYILTDQYRTRTYSHGSASSRSQSHFQDNERTYRPYVPNTYTEDERKIRYRQIQQQQHLQKQQLQDQMQNHKLQYNSAEYKHLDTVDSAQFPRRTTQESHERDFRASNYIPLTDYQVYCKNNNTQSQYLQKRDRDSSCSSKNTLRHTSGTSIEAQLPPGYWARRDDEIVWISTDEQPIIDKFGSLDRRRRNAQYSSDISPNIDAQSRYRTVAVTGTKTSSSNIISSHPHHSVHFLPLSEQRSTNNKMLLRTQSLGSVETWQSNQSHDSHEITDLSAEYANRKSRKKEWYETSLDTEVNAGLDHNLISMRKNTHYQSSPPSIRIKTTVSNNRSAKDNRIIRSSVSPVNRQMKDKVEERHSSAKMQQTHARYDQSIVRPKILEIPAESKPSIDVYDDTIGSLGSSQNCTIVQAGKYQPYREITKPFEMSDFYKYSTKFRKRNENSGQSQISIDSPVEENRPVEYGVRSSDLPRDDFYGYKQNSTAVDTSPVQKRIYQPVQRMTCQPYLTSLR